jgi:hypothetical protein
MDMSICVHTPRRLTPHKLGRPVGLASFANAHSEILVPLHGTRSVASRRSPLVREALRLIWRAVGQPRGKR